MIGKKCASTSLKYGLLFNRSLSDYHYDVAVRLIDDATKEIVPKRANYQAQIPDFFKKSGIFLFVIPR
jgi:hypothetical protein